MTLFFGFSQKRLRFLSLHSWYTLCTRHSHTYSLISYHISIQETNWEGKRFFFNSKDQWSFEKGIDVNYFDIDDTMIKPLKRSVIATHERKEIHLRVFSFSTNMSVLFTIFICITDISLFFSLLFTSFLHELVKKERKLMECLNHYYTTAPAHGQL